MKGKGFDVKVEVGLKINSGDLLLEFDTEAIKKEGYSLVTPVIVTNSDAYEDNALCLNEEIENGRTIINLKELSASI